MKGIIVGLLFVLVGILDFKFKGFAGYLFIVLGILFVLINSLDFFRKKDDIKDESCEFCTELDCHGCDLCDDEGNKL